MLISSFNKMSFRCFRLSSSKITEKSRLKLMIFFLFQADFWFYEWLKIILKLNVSLLRFMRCILSIFKWKKVYKINFFGD